MHINPIIHTRLSFDRWMLPKVAWDGGWLSFHDFLHKHPQPSSSLFYASSAHNPWSFSFPFTPVSESFLNLDIHLSKGSTPQSHLTQQTRIERVASTGWPWHPFFDLIGSSRPVQSSSCVSPKTALVFMPSRPRTPQRAFDLHGRFQTQ